MAITDRILRLGKYMPEFELGDDDFDEVYEAYEEFYRRANTPGRGVKKVEAAEEFYEKVIEYTGAQAETREAAGSSALFFSMTNPGLDLTGEKMSEEELKEALDGGLED